MSFYDPGSIAILWHRELPSTNSAALERIAGGDAGPVWIAAERQTAGRGRSGRAWSDLDGNLAATLLIPLTGPAQHRAQLSFVAGVALANAVHAVATATEPSAERPACHLKWPNDLLIGGAKCAGILVESTSTRGHAAAAVGFGVNLRHAPTVEGRATTSLADHGVESSAHVFLGILSQEMSRTLLVWDGGHGFEAVRSDWLRWSVPINTELEAHDGPIRIRGRFAGLDSDGALRLHLADGTVRRLIAGDVDLAASPVTGNLK